MRTRLHLLSKYFFNLKLRNKFIIPAIAFTLILFLSVGIYIIQDQRAVEETRLQEKADRISYLLLSSNLESIWNVDLENLARNCQAFFEDEEISRLIITDTSYSGDVLINLSKDITGTKDIVKIADFVMGDKKIAKLEVVFSNYFIEQNLAQLRNTFLMLSALVFALMIGLAIVVSQIALKPLQELMTGVQHLAAGDLSFRIPLQSQDELGKLAIAFNAMTDELNLYHDHLQELVDKRTAELKSVNEHLYQEINERKRAEKALRVSETELLALFAGMTDVVIKLNREGRYLKIAPTSPELLYKPADELIGKTLHEIFPQDQADIFMEHIRQCLETQMLVTLEYGLNIGETKVWFDGRIAPMSNDTVVFVARDITVRKQFEVQLNKAKEAAEAANRAKSDFLSNMSHELRTPLNAILGFTELMTRDLSLSHDLMDNLKTIGRSGEHLLSLINDVLELSKIEAGRIVLNQENIDLHRLLLGLEEMFQLRAQEKGLFLNFERGIDIPQYIRTDQNKLRQILINLLGNAVKFTETGGITLRVTNKKPSEGTQTNGCFLHFEVVDTGMGIARDEQGKIFDAFFQTNSQQSSYQGTGLGLPISQKYANIMGGVLVVNSEVARGTSFTFDTPVELVDGTESSQLTRRVAGLEAGQPAFRLLVVEDNEDNRNLLVKLLQTVGFDVQEAANGQDAIEIWDKWQPHLIWMDMRMPVMDGYEATTQIKTSQAGNNTVIIALTASAFEEDRLRMIKHGCNDFVHKPFRESVIFEMIHKHLGALYVYEEDDKGRKSESLIEKMSYEDLLTFINDLPDEIIIKLKEATELSDVAMIDHVIENIRTRSVQLADALSALAEDFNYDKILALIHDSQKIIIGKNEQSET